MNRNFLSAKYKSNNFATVNDAMKSVDEKLKLANLTHGTRHTARVRIRSAT